MVSHLSDPSDLHPPLNDAISFPPQSVIHELTEKCWDACTENYKPSQKFDSRTENCMRNCVERFLDTNILVTERLQKKASEMLSNHDSLGLE